MHNNKYTGRLTQFFAIALLTVIAGAALFMPSDLHARKARGARKHNITVNTSSTSKYNYTGGMLGGKLHGFGICRYKNGNVYYGHWNKDFKDGLGRMDYADGRMEFGTWKKGKYQKPKGIRFKYGEKVYGVDISRHQRRVEWGNLYLHCNRNGKVSGSTAGSYRQPVLFAIMKSTEGATHLDPTFKTNFEKAKEYGITRGAYHFLSVNSTVDAQVRNYIKNTKLQPGDFPPILDIEIKPATMKRDHKKIVEMARKWLQKIEAHYGVRPIIYTSDNYYRTYLKGHGFDKYDFWIARYSHREPSSRHWHIWQFTETGICNGISGKVDINIFKGNFKEFKQYISRYGIKK